MEELKSKKNSVEWKEGTTIYKFGEQSDCAYYLITGEVEIISEKGKTVGFINDKEVFGEQSILLETTRTVTAKASKDTIAMRIPKKTLLDEFNKSSTLIKAILRSTCIRLTNLDNTVKTDLHTES